MALGVEEGVGHAAADGQLVELGHQMAQQIELGRDLGAADDAHHRPLGMAERLVERLQLGAHRLARVGRQQPRHALGRGVGPVGGGEGVVDVDVAELGQLLGEGRVVLLLALVVAQVLQQQHAAGLQRLDRGLGVGTHAVVGERDVLAEQLGQRLDHRLQAHLRHAAALGPVEVGDEHHLGALAGQLADGRQGGAQARVVGDVALAAGLSHRDVEVDADERRLAGEVAGLIEGPEIHRRDPP